MDRNLNKQEFRNRFKKIHYYIVFFFYKSFTVVLHSWHCDIPAPIGTVSRRSDFWYFGTDFYIGLHHRPLDRNFHLDHE